MHCTYLAACVLATALVLSAGGCLECRRACVSKGMPIFKTTQLANTRTLELGACFWALTVGLIRKRWQSGLSNDRLCREPWAVHAPTVNTLREHWWEQVALHLKCVPSLRAGSRFEELPATFTALTLQGPRPPYKGFHETSQVFLG